MSLDAATVKTYRLRPEGYAPAAMKIIVRQLSLLAIVVVPILVGMGAKGLLVDRASLRRAVVPPAVALVLTSAFFAWIARRQFVQGREGWQSYELEVHPGAIRRLHLGLPAVELARDQVTRVVEDPEEGLTIGTVEAERLVFVPRALDGYDEVKAHVRAWGPESVPMAPRGAVVAVVRSVVLVATWIATGVARDPALAMTAGAIMLFVGVWSLAEELRNPLVEVRRKRGVVVLYLLLMAAPLARLWVRFADP